MILSKTRITKALIRLHGCAGWSAPVLFANPEDRFSRVEAHIKHLQYMLGAQWLSGGVLDWRQRGRGFQPHQGNCIVSLSKNINPSIVLVQPRKTRPFITERLLMGRKESNQTNKQNQHMFSVRDPFHINYLIIKDQRDKV